MTKKEIALSYAKVIANMHATRMTYEHRITDLKIKKESKGKLSLRESNELDCLTYVSLTIDDMLNVPLKNYKPKP